MNRRNAPPTPPDRSRLKRIAAVTGGALAAAGAVASVLVFFLPTADGRLAEQPGATGTTATFAPAPPPTTSGAAAPASDSVRALTAMTPVVGAGLVTVRGEDLEAPCPTNQSDDPQREITYELKAPWDRLEGAVSMLGSTDPDDQVGVQVFIELRQDRSDRHVVAAQAVAAGGRTARLSASLKDARRVSLVVTCSSSAPRVRLHALEITRTS